MRALTVLGLTEDGAQLLCEEPASGERFTVPTDDRFRTVVRGVIELPVPAPARPNQQASRETTVEPQLRPRDIQLRVRAGASLAEVAAEAGVDESRIEKFAYPVLMERGSMADRARKARTMIGGVPSSNTVEELSLRTLSARGQSASAAWDAYREETGNWVLTLTWFAGHSDNVAHWSIHSGSGTVSAIDDAAADLLDPSPRPLRRVPEQVVEQLAEVPSHPMVLSDDERTAQSGSTVGHPSTQISGNSVAAALATHAVRPAEAENPAARTGTDDARSTPVAGSRSGKKPSMPSWEDVLLGVRQPKG